MRSSRSRVSTTFFCQGLALATMLVWSSPLHSADRYQIDPDHATVGFLVEHVGFARVLGSFSAVEGEFLFDEERGVLEDIRVVIQTATVDTRVAARDRHLRSEDFLDVERYPEMVFEAKGTTLDENRQARLQGQLTLLGKTREVDLEVTWNKSATSPIPINGRKPYVLGASARGVLLRSEFGMDYGLADLLVGDEIELILEIEARRVAD